MTVSVLGRHTGESLAQGEPKEVKDTGLKLIVCVVLAALTATSGCSLDSSERCDELDSILVARGEQLPKLCETDSDCVVVEVRPGIPAVTNQPFDPESVRYLQTEREMSCGPFERRYRAATPLCEPDGVNRRCELQVESIYLDRDAGVDTDEVVCDCESVQDCGESAPHCLGCVCRDECGVACYSVDQCGELQNLGYGRSVDDCTVRCNDLIERDPAQGNALVSCLTTSACADLEACP